AVTDFRTRTALTPVTLETIARSSHAVVHLSTIEGGEAEVGRDDDDRWATAARATGGLLWHALAPLPDAPAASKKTAVAVFEEWARPLRVDRLTLHGIGVDGDLLGVPVSMAEGQGFEDLRVQKYAPPAIMLEGELWSTKTKTLLEPTNDGNRLWSALVFGSA